MSRNGPVETAIEGKRVRLRKKGVVGVNGRRDLSNRIIRSYYEQQQQQQQVTCSDLVKCSKVIVVAALHCMLRVLLCRPQYNANDDADRNAIQPNV